MIWVIKHNFSTHYEFMMCSRFRLCKLVHQPSNVRDVTALNGKQILFLLQIKRPNYSFHLRFIREIKINYQRKCKGASKERKSANALNSLRKISQLAVVIEFVGCGRRGIDLKPHRAVFLHRHGYLAGLFSTPKLYLLKGNHKCFNRKELLTKSDTLNVSEEIC